MTIPAHPGVCGLGAAAFLRRRYHHINHRGATKQPMLTWFCHYISAGRRRTMRGDQQPRVSRGRCDGMRITSC
ncbi:hypothetical protein HQ394_03885 [Defluviicoccus vanus]|uniref:Uncharacterized protein n=1 Tax=Defluviicoccus vanus TaxID=111831 RepID=A0A7H1MYX8_9PROT|nr:hypothetical protein HQ394_03885 [Defluviicoccus vanus]